MERGLSRYRLAEAVGVIPVTFNKWLTKCQSGVPAWVMPALARVLGVSLDYLLTGHEDDHGRELRRWTKKARKSLASAVSALEQLEAASREPRRAG